jgi:hypothetical protein
MFPRNDCLTRVHRDTLRVNAPGRSPLGDALNAVAAAAWFLAPLLPAPHVGDNVGLAAAPDMAERAPAALAVEMDSAFAIALHMHQPLVPADGPDLRTAPVISNLKWMLDHPDIGDNHNAPVFLWCYKRMGEFVPQLLGGGPRRGSCSSTRACCCTACARWARTTCSTLWPASPPTRATGRRWSGWAVRGARGGAIDPGPGLLAARAGLAAPLRRPVRGVGNNGARNRIRPSSSLNTRQAGRASPAARRPCRARAQAARPQP